MSDAISQVNGEVRIRWTGSAQFDATQAEWAMRYAITFAYTHTDPAKKTARTGLRRGEFLTGGILGGFEKKQQAMVYFTPSGVVVVRIHGDVGS